MILSTQELSDLLKKLAPKTSKAKRERFVAYLADALPRYQIDSRKRISAFIATCCFESDYFKATEEYADGWEYDKSRNPRKAKKLGNTEKGDGPKYKGRSLIQETGRGNYTELTKHRDEFSAHLGPVPDFVLAPEALAEPKWAVEASCYFWKSHKLNLYADIHDFDAIQGVVNRGDPEKKAKDLVKRRILFGIAESYLNSLTPAAPQSLPNASPVESPSLVDGVSPSPEPAIFNNDVDGGKDVPKFSVWQSVITWISNAVTWLQGVATRSADVEATVSRSSWATVILNKSVGYILLGFGALADRPIYLPIGLALIGFAIWYLKHSKTRASNERIAKLK